MDNSTAKLIEAANKIQFNASEIDQMLKAWEENECLSVPESILTELFPSNIGFTNDEKREFLKISTLNQVYGTNLYTEDIRLLANYFANNDKNLNIKLFKGDKSLISDITCAVKKERGRFCYSFATKYCSFAASTDNFPIYDRYMSVLYKTRTDIWNPDGKKGFYKYYFDPWKGDPEKDNNRYEMYSESVHMMQKELSKERNLTVKQLDQYLWYAMKYYWSGS